MVKPTPITKINCHHNWRPRIVSILGLFYFMYQKIIAIVFCFLPNVVMAGSFDFQLQPALRHFSLNEFGRYEVTEEGYLEGLSLNVRWSPLNQLGLIIASGRWQGDVDYDGHTQLGASFNTHTQYRVEAFEGTAMFNINQNVAMLLGLRDTEWDRHIQSNGNVRDLLEMYHWRAGIVGTQWQWPIARNQTVKFIGSVHLLNNVTMDIHFTDEAIASSQLQGISGRGTDLTLEYEACINRHCFSVAFSDQVYNFSESDPLLINRNHFIVRQIEPSTQWTMQSLALSWRYNLAW